MILPNLSDDAVTSITYMFPLMQIWQVDAPGAVDVSTSLEHHGTGGLHKHHWGVVWVRVHQPQTYRDVVSVPCEHITRITISHSTLLSSMTANHTTLVSLMTANHTTLVSLMSANHTTLISLMTANHTTLISVMTANHTTLVSLTIANHTTLLLYVTANHITVLSPMSDIQLHNTSHTRDSQSHNPHLGYYLLQPIQHLFQVCQLITLSHIIQIH